MNHPWRNLLENSLKPPPKLGEFIDFLKRMKNPPNAVAQAALDDPIFGNLFDRVELDPKPQGTKGVIQSTFKVVSRICVPLRSSCSSRELARRSEAENKTSSDDHEAMTR